MTTNFDLGTMLSLPAAENQVKLIACDMLLPYHNHKFSLYTGERLDDMVESIKKNGILIPIIVQPADGGQYEILIGHNRWNAAKIAGINEVPAIVKEHLSEEEAEMYVIESNVMQRGFNNLKISEQAEVIKIRHDKMFSQGKRNDIIRELQLLENPEVAETSSPVDTKSKKGKTTMDKVGEEYGMSRASVARLLRISKCCDNIKSLIDNALISIRVGVDLSYLTYEEQEIVSAHSPKKLNMKVSELLKKRAGTLTENEISEIINGKSEKSVKQKPIKLEYEAYSKFFADDAKPEEIQEIIIKALKAYFSV